MNSGILAVVGAQLCFAIGAVFLKKLTVTVHPVLANALIALCGLVALLPVFWYFSKEITHLSPAQWTMAAWRGILVVAIANMLLAYGITKAPLSHVSLLALLYPFFVTGLAIVFFGEPLTVKFLLASSFFIAGYLVLVL